MSAVVFDTLKYAKRLKEGGFTEQQAEALANAQVDVLHANLATKADLKDAITDLKTELKADIADLKAALEARFAPIESDLRWTRWIITGGVGLYVLRSMVEWIR